MMREIIAEDHGAESDGVKMEEWKARGEEQVNLFARYFPHDNSDRWSSCKDE